MKNADELFTVAYDIVEAEETQVFDVEGFLRYCENLYGMKTEDFLKWFQLNESEGNVDMQLWAMFAICDSLVNSTNDIDKEKLKAHFRFDEEAEHNHTEAMLAYFDWFSKTFKGRQMNDDEVQTLQTFLIELKKYKDRNDKQKHHILDAEEAHFICIRDDYVWNENLGDYEYTGLYVRSFPDNSKKWAVQQGAFILCDNLTKVDAEYMEDQINFGHIYQKLENKIHSEG